MKKRLLLIFVALVFLLFSFFTTKAEIAKAYAVCSKEMSTREGYGIWKYQDASFFPEVVFVFSDGCNEADCYVRRNSSGWYISSVFETLVNCLL